MSDDKRWFELGIFRFYTIWAIYCEIVKPEKKQKIKAYCKVCGKKQITDYGNPYNYVRHLEVRVNCAYKIISLF